MALKQLTETELREFVLWLHAQIEPMDEEDMSETEMECWRRLNQEE